MSILSVCIKADAAGIGIPASNISVRYRNIPVPNCVPLFCYLTLVSASFSFRSCSWWKDTMHDKNCPYCWWWKETCTSMLPVLERHPARPYCWWWKDNLPSILLVVDKNTTCMSEQRWWWCVKLTL